MDEVYIREWKTGHKLRDDKASGIREDQAYSLFEPHEGGFKRVMVFGACTLEWALAEIKEEFKLGPPLIGAVMCRRADLRRSNHLNHTVTHDDESEGGFFGLDH